MGESVVDFSDEDDGRQVRIAPNADVATLRRAKAPRGRLPPTARN
jgi:hypothetical protein